MSKAPRPPETLSIKKYPNRRFYDATRSCHVTLSDLHALITEGYDLVITDSATGADITNLVLTQIIMEHDPPKLEFFPANILHEVIRTQRQMLDTVFEQFFRQMVQTQQASQAQWTRFLQNTLGLGAPVASNPLQWTQSLMSAMMPPATDDAESTREAQDKSENELQELRAQLAELTRRVEELNGTNRE